MEMSGQMSGQVSDQVSGRNFLTGWITLSRNEDGSSPERYFIRSVIGEGGSTVCYEAARVLKDGTVETGKLKEFYPAESVDGDVICGYLLERLPDGQLVASAGDIRQFEEMCREYIGTYRLLRQVIAENPDNEILKSYIQYGEILYGILEKEQPGEKAFRSPLSILKKWSQESSEAAGERRPSVYIWSPGVPGKGFNQYLDEVRNSPSSKSEEKLENILRVFIELTDCIKALHTAGLMHMDINPSNFLVQYDSDYKIKANNISLFDINTLCSIKSEEIRPSGTEGYCAPEVIRGRADNRSDIYSLGAMLFHALVITPDVPDGLYHDYYYSRISQLVRHSALFQASETNSDATLMSRICKILEKCLARDPRKRYQSCSELKEDFKKAEDRLSRILSMPAPKSKAGLSDPTLTIQKLLYEHPLYGSVPEGVTDINVLMIGAGTYGQRFLDICLQSGQMADVNLNICAVSDEPEKDKEAYLQFRPAICEFVNVDGSMVGARHRAYANLEFHSVSETLEGESAALQFTTKPSQVNREIVENLFLKAMYADKKYNYVFVALGNDALSRSVAALCAEYLDDPCPVCYISEKTGRSRRADQKNLYPVYINEPVYVSAIDQNLAEMAFNTHIAWNSKSMLNMDVTKERNIFFKGETAKEKYNRSSSLAFVLSIKYKLHSVGIDCEDPLEMAVQFQKQILDSKKTDEEAKAKFDRLVELEHRRWILEKAADGWTAPRDGKGQLKLADCVTRRDVKDNANRTHPCLVYSIPGAPLEEPEYTENHHKKWDEGEIDPGLDDLDRMSIELHRCFKREADQLRAEALSQNPDLTVIQNLIPNECVEAVRAFKQFRFALKNIISGVESYTRQYDYYSDSLKASLGGLSEEARVKIEERLAVIERDFFPVIESNLYRNYKEIDYTLVEKIPFILTFRYMPSIAMALEDGKYLNGRNDVVFANVAAATILSPEKITFFYCCYPDSSVELLVRKLDAILNYFCGRNVHCAVRLVISCMKEISGKEYENLQKELKRLEKKHQEGSGNSWLESSVLTRAGNYADAAEQFAEDLKKNPVSLYDGGTALFPSAYENARFIDRITSLQIPYFEFDWRNKEFTKRIGCEYLRFVKDGSFIRIRDMFGLMNAADTRYTMPEFSDDYEALWDIYTGKYLSNKRFENGVGNWNRLCMHLQKYEADQKPLVRIALSTAANPVLVSLTYFLPDYTFSTVKRLLQELAEYQIVEKDYLLTSHTSDTCRLELKANVEYEKHLNTIFQKPQYLLPYYGLETRKYKSCNGDYVDVKLNLLTVRNLDLDPDGTGKWKYSHAVLKQLEKAHFISQLEPQKDPGPVSFVYSSSQIKKLLTSAGEILEVYAYYDVLKTGYFDDVACGYEFGWEKDGVKNELDLIMTKGFRSIIVECKAVVELKLDYYHKLHSIANQFGIGTTTVLLGNTYAHSNAVANELNTMQRSRGDQLSIKTISAEDKIIHIGQTLKQLMEDET
ncbi:MAG: protein kinase [Lachnospiraceae bacterium]|nr:protein kinase [Lachnospiraceae bacterium]